MKRLLPALLGLCLILPVHASDERCLISFDSGGFDACSGAELGPVHANGLAGALPAAAADSRHQVIKFDRPITRRMRAAVEATGVEILAYLPFHSYLVRVDEMAMAQRLSGLEGMLWTGPFQTNWKLDLNLAQLDEAVERPAALPLHVALHPGFAAEPLRAQLAALPGVEHSFVDVATSREAVVLNVLGARIDELLPLLVAIDEVAHVGVRKLMNFNNSQGTWLHQSGQNNLRPMFDRGLFGCGQLVGVADSGVDFPHCAFADQALSSPVISTCTDGAGCPAATPDFDHRKIPIYYKWSPANDPLGDSACPGGTSSGHGTHVAGSILGNNLANPVDCASLSTPGGVTDLDGMAPGARLVAQELGDTLQYLNDLGGNIPHLISVAHANGARIHNNSWGGGCCFLGLFCLPGCSVTYDAFSQDADRAAWDFPDMAIFFAAGNDGSCCAAPRSVGSPGNAKNVISVGATQRGTAGDAIASFSSRGPVHDGRTKPDIVAQGQGVVSVGSNGSAASGSCATCTLSGTSMATPTAAGMAALVREYLERGFYPSGVENAADARDFISGALIKAMLVNGRDSISGASSGGPAPNQNQGWGRVNLSNVLHFEGQQRRLWLADQADGLVTDEVYTQILDVEAGEPLLITLSWTDFPAAIGASVALVNRLRLEVVDPDGQVWTQKLPASGTPNPFFDTSDTGHDNRNNIHQIRFDTPLAGEYEIRVRAIQVAMGDRQPFALVANGALAVDAARAQLSPESISMVMQPDSKGTSTLSISNLGTLPLEWELVTDGSARHNGPATGVQCADPAELGWLSIAPVSGTVEPDATESLMLAFDSAGMNHGELMETVLCLASNDPQQGLLLVPVQMRVEPDPMFSNRFEDEQV